MKFNDEISNVGLQFSMEFGENWLKPINERLFRKYPNLNKNELDKYDKLCEKVNKIGNDFVRKNPEKINGKLEFIDIKRFEIFMLEKYNWISDENLNRLYSQSCYYAMK